MASHFSEVARHMTKDRIWNKKPQIQIPFLPFIGSVNLRKCNLSTFFLILNGDSAKRFQN